MELFQEQIDRLLQLWDQLSQRDKWALQVLMGVLLIAGLWGLIWSPIMAYKSAAEERYQSEVELNQTLERQKTLLGAGGNRSFSSGSSKQSLVSLVTASSGRYKLTVSRYEPKKNNGIRVWFESAQFNVFLKWLHELQKNRGIDVSDITIERSKAPGLVRVNLVLERG